MASFVLINAAPMPFYSFGATVRPLAASTAMHRAVRPRRRFLRGGAGKTVSPRARRALVKALRLDESPRG
jgi:hypothetical protein